MTHRQRIHIVAGLALLIPCAAWANGWEHVEAGFEISTAGGALGCVAGLVVALVRRVGAGRLFLWTIGAGLAGSLFGTLSALGVYADFFFPNNAGIALAIALGSALLAAAAGAILAAVGMGIREVMRRTSDDGAQGR